MAKIKIKKVSFLNSSGEQEIYVIPEGSSSTSIRLFSGVPDSSSSTSIRLFSGIGAYEGDNLESTLGLTPMPGYNDPLNDNYGNYKNSDGSVFVFIPKFYYTFDCKPEETHYQDTLTYSGLTEKQLAQIVTRSPLNYMAIASGKAFENEAEANQHGFILHRAFIDGGQEKSGFFIMKYLASKGTDGTSNKALSVKNGRTISLAIDADSEFQPSVTMPGCSGNLKDALILSKAINPNLNCASAFMYSALAMQSKFIGTIVTDTSQCAWYDSNLVTNFPKGCNNAYLSDINDSFVVYTSQIGSKPLTGSGSPFNKTTHNGLNSGVCDLNGCMWQIATGVGWAGNRVLRLSSKLSDIEASTVDNQSASYYVNTGYSISTTGKWGNASSSSWRKDASGINRDLEGVYPKVDSGMSSNGTNEFGTDYCYAYSDSSAVFCSGSWGGGSDAGVFRRDSDSWTDNFSSWGFRSAGYAS